MRVVSTIAEARAAARELRAQQRRTAFVPTMGALHEGHLTLVRQARARADVVIASIFVNPLQFGPNEDLAKYPRTLDADLNGLRDAGVSLVFTPTPDEMYREGRAITVNAMGHDDTFEGAIRPDHFTGVLTVVAKLFNVVQPDVACFGQKDLQQLSLIQRMVRDLDFPIEIVSVPTVREPDGLAMSSRNRYLSPDDRARAPQLQAALQAVREAFVQGEREARQLRAIGMQRLAEDAAIGVDYLEVIDPVPFVPVERAEAGSAVILAARVGGTRLLDNVIL